ncbi:GNAT family N-acetyltransferase [Heliobacillus mobilis]|uniref:GNAT family N-acetyltransferase n=1 Tax=Heliobacterium mobile TaxID=28064 RepID=A0A6I3SKW5_HELMO|nr:GNAT family protein [Heliobacterium mobile]MTV49147.1 GNAT family N-acetyltransferase [Heliobacterium mobile]
MRVDLSKCTIRSWDLNDNAGLLVQANNWNVAKTLRDHFPYPYTETDGDNWLNWVVRSKPETNFAITSDGSIVGGIGFNLQPDVYWRSAEIGYWLGEDYWGQGIMTEAVPAMTAYAFKHFDVCRIFASVFETNPASMRVLEKSGYTFEARLRKSVTKNGVTFDELIYSTVI